MLTQRLLRAYSNYPYSQAEEEKNRPSQNLSAIQLPFQQDFRHKEDFTLLSKKFDSSIRNCTSCVFKVLVIT